MFFYTQDGAKCASHAPWSWYDRGKRLLIMSELSLFVPSLLMVEYAHKSKSDRASETCGRSCVSVYALVPLLYIRPARLSSSGQDHTLHPRAPTCHPAAWAFCIGKRLETMFLQSGSTGGTMVPTEYSQANHSKRNFGSDRNTCARCQLKRAVENVRRDAAIARDLRADKDERVTSTPPLSAFLLPVTDC